MDVTEYAGIADARVVGPLSQRERDYIRGRLEAPSDAFMELAVRLARDGCEFPKQQAALMMLNSPAEAQVLLREVEARG